MTNDEQGFPIALYGFQNASRLTIKWGFPTFESMKGIGLIVLIIYALTANAQLVPDRTEHDFGTVTATSNRTTDFYIINNYKFTLVKSSFSFDMEYSDAHQPSMLQPGDTLLYRVKIRPEKTGPWKKTIKMSFFQHPDTLTFILKANVKTTQFKDIQPLDAFERKLRKGDEKPKDFPVRFKVIDLKTKRPIPDASINFSANNVPHKHITTNAKGKAERILHNGYRVSISATGYNAAYINISAGCNDEERIVELSKYDASQKTEFDYHYEFEENNPITNDTIEEVLSSTIENDKVLEPLSKGNYKPNNIVFLMDISGSMTDHKRMNLLKTSMIQMIELMRNVDLVTIITFSSETRVLVPTTNLNAINRKQIAQKLKALKPSGMTNGGKGLKMAFKLAKESFGSEKNNQVILSTDGALNSYMDHDAIIKLVKKYANAIQTSVVTLKGYTWTKKYMDDIVRGGKGRLLPINSEQDAKTMLIREIKTNSIIQ